MRRPEGYASGEGGDADFDELENFQRPLPVIRSRQVFVAPSNENRSTHADPFTDNRSSGAFDPFAGLEQYPFVGTERAFDDADDEIAPPREAESTLFGGREKPFMEAEDGSPSVSPAATRNHSLGHEAPADDPFGFVAPAVMEPAQREPAQTEPASGQMDDEMQRLLDRRAGQHGLMGFCPVALREERRLVDGRKEFRSVRHGHEYSFSSAEAKREFDSNPDRYAPVAEGADVVLAAGDVLAPGSLRYAVFYGGRLYLFRSEQTLALFCTDPLRYVGR